MCNNVLLCYFLQFYKKKGKEGSGKWDRFEVLKPVKSVSLPQITSCPQS